MANSYNDAVVDALPPDDRMRIGTVISGNPFTVNVEGTPVESGRLESYGPLIGDSVAMVRQDSTWLALGRIIGSTTPGRGVSSLQISRATADLDLTAASQLIAGTTMIVTTTIPNAVAVCLWVADFDAIGTTATTGVVELFVNGVALAHQALFNSGGTQSGGRSTVFQMDPIAFPNPGAQALQLQGRRVGGADANLRVHTVHTGLLVVTFE